MTLSRLGAAAALLLVSLTGCIASNVVAKEDRQVAAPLQELAFAPAPGLQFDGLYESVDVTGDAAVSLRRVFYLFRPDGSYTAAALVEGPDGASFQTLDGTWSSDDRGLSLDGGEPVPLDRAGDHVRLSAPNGAVVLRRSALQ